MLFKKEERLLLLIKRKRGISMLNIINTRLGVNRGTPRVWLEGKKLISSFVPGQKIKVHVDSLKKVVSFFATTSDDYDYTVSKRERNGRVRPLIEIKDKVLSEIFGEKGALLRVVIKNGSARIEAHGLDKNVTERCLRFCSKIKSGEDLSIGSLFSGGGIIDAAIHKGMKLGGINTYTKFVVEQEQKYLDTMVANQPDLFRSDSILIESKIEAVELRNPPKVDGMVLGIPCTGASRAGITRNKIKAAEFHDEAGACFFYALQLIGLCQPAFIIIENVKEYLKTTSMAVIQSVLKTWGYELQFAVFNGVKFGTLENRDRMVLMAVTKGLNSFDIESVKPVVENTKKVSDILEVIDSDDERWKTYEYLATKEIRDRDEGKGFRRQLLDGTESSVPTIRRLYHKAGSTDPFLKHSDGLRSRLFTALEHSRIKGIPADSIHGVSNTTAHEILGQSVCFPVFLALGRSIGDWLSDLSGSKLVIDISKGP